MLNPLKSNTGRSGKKDRALSNVRRQMANHLIGNVVEILVGSRTILHGIVSGVLTEAGKPKILVNGRRYDINQVLTVLPASLN
jgi:hypothetical protein